MDDRYLKNKFIEIICKILNKKLPLKGHCAYEPVAVLFVNRFLSFLYASIEAVEPFGRDDVELSADDVFDSEDADDDVDDELSEPEELDFEIKDLDPADADEADDANVNDDDDDEYAVLFELN